MSIEGEDPRDLIRRALAGEPASVRALVDRLSPVIQRSAAAVLRRGPGGRDARQEVMDMTSEVFAALFQAEGKALRAWDPARGRTLESFVSLLARNQILTILRTGRRSPWPDDPTDDEQLEKLCGTSLAAEQIVSSREYLHRLLDRVRTELSPVHQELFQCFVIDDEAVEQVAARFNMTVQALYKWRSRLLQRLRALSEELLDSSESRGLVGRAGDQRSKKESSQR